MQQVTIMKRRATNDLKPEPISEETKKIIFQTPVSGFGFKDFSTHGVWVLDRIRQHWPNLHERTVFSWLRGCAESKDFHFVRTDHAVGLVGMTLPLLDPAPIATEIFILADDPCNHAAILEGAAIYAAMWKWAKERGVKEFVIEKYSDIPRHFIEAAIGPVSSRGVAYKIAAMP